VYLREVPKVNPAISGGMPKMLKVGVFSFDVGHSMFDVGVFAYLDVHLFHHLRIILSKTAKL